MHLTVAVVPFLLQLLFDRLLDGCCTNYSHYFNDTFLLLLCAVYNPKFLLSMFAVRL